MLGQASMVNGVIIRSYIQPFAKTFTLSSLRASVSGLLDPSCLLVFLTIKSSFIHSFIEFVEDFHKTGIQKLQNQWIKCI